MTQTLKIIPLGGVEEIGKNVTVIEYGDDIVVVDYGMAFPDEEMLGIDYVIPDPSYLIQNAERVRGILITHGHEDHIGALPYLLRELDAPVYGTRLTIGLIQAKLQEYGIQKDNLHIIHARDVIRLGSMQVEFLKTNHSIIGSVAMAITTPAGVVIHTGDFKVDYTPIDGKVIDLPSFARYGSQGVLALLSDSTNIEVPGYTIPERSVGDTLDDLFSNIKGRIIISTFSSHIHRIQQIVQSAKRYHRKVCLTGRSMLRNVGVAIEQGVLEIEPEQMVDISAIDQYRPEEMVVITTGSQGEPMSGLVRMATHQHGQISIGQGDTVIISALPIPGNEKFISRVVDQMFRSGADVIYGSLAKIHVSGHACQEELKLMLTLTNPKYFIPVHGHYRHLRQHAQLAQSLGIPQQNIVLPKIGTVIEIDETGIREGETVPAGGVMVDGLGIGDVGNVVLRDRKRLSDDGLVIVVMTLSEEDGTLVAEPEIISRGFVYVKTNEDLMESVKELVEEVCMRNEAKSAKQWAPIKSNVKNTLSHYLYERTKRRPMILPIVVEI